MMKTNDYQTAVRAAVADFLGRFRDKFPQNQASALRVFDQRSMGPRSNDTSAADLSALDRPDYNPTARQAHPHKILARMLESIRELQRVNAATLKPEVKRWQEWIRGDGADATRQLIAALESGYAQWPAPAGRRKLPAYDYSKGPIENIWDNANAPIDEVLDVCWFLYRHNRFQAWWNDATEVQTDERKLPSVIDRLIFATNQEGRDNWDSFKDGTIPPGRHRTATGGPRSAIYALHGFFVGPFADSNGKRASDLFGDDQTALLEAVKDFREILDEEPSLQAQMETIRQGLKHAKQQIDRIYELRMARSPSQSNDMVRNLTEADFLPATDEDAYRFLRGGFSEFRHVANATVSRPEEDVVKQQVRDGWRQILIHSPIATGRSTMLKRLAFHYCQDGWLVWFVQDNGAFLQAMEAAMGSIRPEKTIVFFDDVHEPTIFGEHSTPVARIPNWMDLPPLQRPVLIFSAQTRFLEGAQASMQWRAGNIDINQLQSIRSVVEVNSHIEWEQVEALHVRYNTLDDGKTTVEAKQDFEEFQDKSIFAANFSATRTNGLKGHFSTLIEEARHDGWLYTLAAIVIVNRVANRKVAEGAHRYLVQAWRPAVDWLLLPAGPEHRRPGLGQYQADAETDDGLDKILSDKLRGEVVRAFGDNRNQNLTLRSPLITKILEEAIFGWSDGIGAAREFKAPKLDWLVSLAGYVGDPLFDEGGVLSNVNDGLLANDLSCLVEHYIREVKIVSKYPALSQGHFEPLSASVSSLYRRFATYLDSPQFDRFRSDASNHSMLLDTLADLSDDMAEM